MVKPFTRASMFRGAIVLAAALVLGACSGGGSEAPAASGSAPAEPAQTFEWKIVTTWPKNLPGMGVGVENMAKLIDEMSNGRLRIKVFAAGELVPAFGTFDAVMSGSAEMGHGAAYYWRGRSPIAAMFTAVPFGLNAQEMNGWLHYGGGMELWRELYAQFGLVPIAGGNTGVQMAGWFNREINSLDDLKGLKMRIPGLGGEVFTRAGGTAINVPGGEIFTSFQTGVIDATEWVGPYNDLAFGLYQVADYYYYPGWQEPGPALEVIVNRDAWDSLPPDLQKILETAARATNQDMLDEFTARNADALNTLVTEHGVELRRLPDDVLVELHRIAEEVLADMGQQDDFSRRVYESFTTYRDKVRAYHRISEQAYINARDMAAGD